MGLVIGSRKYSRGNKKEIFLKSLLFRLFSYSLSLSNGENYHTLNRKSYENTFLSFSASLHLVHELIIMYVCFHVIFVLKRTNDINETRVLNFKDVR